MNMNVFTSFLDLFFIASLLVLINQCYAYKIPNTYLAITSGEPKCIIVNSSKGTFLSISYDTPDVKMNPLKQNDPNANYSYKMMDQEQEIKNRMEYYQQKRREMQHMNTGRSRDGPLSTFSKILMTVTNVKVSSLAQEDLHTEHYKENYQIIEPHGRFKFQLKYHDNAKICVTIQDASEAKPSFIGILVKEANELDDFYYNEKKEAEKEAIQQREIDNGREHLRWMEKELHKLISRANAIERVYHNSSKPSHAEFFQVSEKLALSLKWWSILQLMILGIAAIINAKIMQNQLKKKGVIF